MKTPDDLIRRVLNTIHTACLAAASGVIIATGVAAAVAFPTMRDLNPRLADLATIDDHWMIAAGSVMAQVFLVTAVIVGGAIGVALIAFTMQLLLASRRAFGATVVRFVAIAALVAVFTHYAAILLPDMNRTFDAFVAAGRANDIEQAAKLRREFDELHPLASRELGAIAVLALAAALLSALPLHRTGGPRA